MPKTISPMIGNLTYSQSLRTAFRKKKNAPQLFRNVGVFNDAVKNASPHIHGGHLRAGVGSMARYVSQLLLPKVPRDRISDGEVTALARRAFRVLLMPSPSHLGFGSRAFYTFF